MSSGHHEEHHSAEQKPVAFTVPFILASVTILAVVLFLSLCDPKPHEAHHGKENNAHAKFEGDQSSHHAAGGHEDHAGDAAASTAKDTAEAGHEHHEDHH